MYHDLLRSTYRSSVFTCNNLCSMSFDETQTSLITVRAMRNVKCICIIEAHFINCLYLRPEIIRQIKLENSLVINPQEMFFSSSPLYPAPWFLCPPQCPLAQFFRVASEEWDHFCDEVFVLFVNWDALVVHLRQDIIYRRLAPSHKRHQPLVIYSQYVLTYPTETTNEKPLPVIFVPLVAESLDAHQPVHKYCHTLMSAVLLARLG